MASHPLFVREASQHDSSTVAQLLDLSKEEAKLYRGSPFIPQSGSTVESLTLVGGFGSSVMGTLWAVRTSDSVWFIRIVFVRSDCREVGIGDALVLFALDRLSKMNATRVESSALPGDRATKNLFERHGLIAQTILVGRSLSDPSIRERASQ